MGIYVAPEHKTRYGLLTQAKLEQEDLLGLEGSALTIRQERASLMNGHGTGWEGGSAGKGQSEAGSSGKGQS